MRGNLRFHRRSKGWFLLFGLIATLLPVCSLGLMTNKPAAASPRDTGDGWHTASPNEAGLKAGPLAAMVKAIERGDYQKIHAVLLVRGGRIVLEEYFGGYSQEKLHPIRSATKSFGSVLIGIAVDEGLIPGAEEPVERYFKDQTSAWGDRAGAVTIKSLLTMTCGLDCDDHGDDSFKCEREMRRAEDWVNFALGLPMVHPPGKHWAYNSATLILLSEIITQTSGLSVPQFAERYLFEPLGIKEFKWCFSPKGRAWMAGSAFMRPRDMARFGQMCLDKGVWNNRRIVSEKWLVESTRLHSHSEFGMEYGYLWWHGRHIMGGRSLEAFWAEGNGGQVIFICPAIDLVAVFTAGNYNSLLEFQFMGLLINHILPAILPPGPERTFVDPNYETLTELPGSYRCHRLLLRVSVEDGRLAGRLNGQTVRFLLEGNDRFFIPNPVLGDMTGRIVRDANGRPTELTINAAFSELQFHRSD